MATRTYYGTCKTASGETEKRVYVPDTDLTDEFNFKEGDLLVVFFAQTNTQSEPIIVVYNQDPELETSTTNDSGKFIKSTDVEANMENAWAAGETVIFAYTQLSTQDTYYWELIDAFHASTDTYGNTKLFDTNNLIDLLSPETDENKYADLALTPKALRDFLDLLNGKYEEKQDEGEEGGEEGDEGSEGGDSQPGIRVIGLNWIPNPDIEGEMQPLGTLSLTGDAEGGIEVDYPLDARILQLIQANVPNVPTYTAQLINNGNGKDGDVTAEPSEGAEPFITRMIPNDLYFGNANGIYYGTPEDRKNMISIGDGVLTVGNNSLTGDGIVLDKATKINGNLLVNGTIDSGAISAGSQQISTTGVIKSSVLYEGFSNSNAGTPISQIYSKKLFIVAKDTVNFTVPKSGLKDGYESVARNDGRAIGLVGYNITNRATGDGYASYCLPYSMMFYQSGQNVRWQLRNTNSSHDAHVHISFQILYERI